MIPKPKNVRFKEKKKRDPDVQRACIHRDGMCMVCGRVDDTLIGHHIESFGSSGNDTVENMITLCSPCHDNAERGYIDYSKTNLPMRKYIPAPKGYMLGFAGSDMSQVPKVWECDNIFKEILRGEYG